jgi:hypothetical protein
MRATVRDGDQSAVCARAGGLVLRARPEPETLNRASRARRRRPRAASARRGSPQRRLSTRTSARGTPRRSPRCTGYAPLPTRRRALWRTRSAWLRCGAARCVRRHRRCARACAHVQALACAGRCVEERPAGGEGRYMHPNMYIYIYVYVCVRLCVTRVHIHTLSSYLYM